MAALFCRLSLISSLALGCASASPTPVNSGQNRAATPPAETAGAALLDRGWGRVALPRAALELSLPELSGWRKAKPSAWEHLRHAASRSRLDLRVTRAERLVRPEDCEARARLEHPELPVAEDDEALDRRTLRAPRGFLTRVTVLVAESAPAELEGHVTAFGAAVGRCFALHFSTRTSGPGASEEVARRLGLVVAKLLPSVALADVDQRVTPEPFAR